MPPWYLLRGHPRMLSAAVVLEVLSCVLADLPTGCPVGRQGGGRGLPLSLWTPPFHLVVVLAFPLHTSHSVLRCTRSQGRSVFTLDQLFFSLCQVPPSASGDFLS